MIFQKNRRDSDFIPKICKICEFWKNFSAILLSFKNDPNISILSAWAFAEVEIFAQFQAYDWINLVKLSKNFFHRIQHRNPFFLWKFQPTKTPTHWNSIYRAHFRCQTRWLKIFSKFENLTNFRNKVWVPRRGDSRHLWFFRRFFSDFLQISNLSTSSEMVTACRRFGDGFGRFGRSGDGPWSWLDDGVSFRESSSKTNLTFTTEITCNIKIKNSNTINF